MTDTKLRFPQQKIENLIYKILDRKGVVPDAFQQAHIMREPIPEMVELAKVAAPYVLPSCVVVNKQQTENVPLCDVCGGRFNTIVQLQSEAKPEFTLNLCTVGICYRGLLSSDQWKVQMFRSVISRNCLSDKDLEASTIVNVCNSVLKAAQDNLSLRRYLQEKRANATLINKICLWFDEHGYLSCRQMLKLGEFLMLVQNKVAILELDT